MEKKAHPRLLKQPTHLISMGFGTGLIPVAPGTFGTLVAIPLYWLMQDFVWWYYGLVVLLCLLLGVVVSRATAETLGEHDHQSIVWDEVVGYLITMIAAPPGWPAMVAGFILFRVFDIAKPWPIAWIDRKVQGGWGIMLDDVLAGIYGAVIVGFMGYAGWI